MKPRYYFLLALAVFACIVAITVSQNVASLEWYVGRLVSEGEGRTLYTAAILEIAREHGIAFGVQVVDAAVKERVISNDECHTLLHLLGHESYLVHGNSWDDVFDTNSGRICLGGYLHGVEAQIAAEGIGARTVLWDFCEEMRARGLNNGPCFHGVGHSAFEYGRDVDTALAFCDALAGGPEPELWNCYRGVFSELGNAIVGVDTNTGQPTERLMDARIPADDPFALCDSLAASYRGSCYSQLSKVFYQSTDPAGSIRACVLAAASDEGKRHCANILAGVASRVFLDSEDVLAMKTLVESLDEGARGAALDGFRETLIAYARNGGTLAWPEFCALFVSVDIRERCTVATVASP